MARRKKKRAQPGPEAAAKTPPTNTRDGTAPKSMVIRIGANEIGPSVSQLVKDVRAMMEPGTASKLRERKSNKLRDYTSMAGPLGVTHLLLFSRSASGNTNLRLALTPRGPTLHFQIARYSLCKDVRKALRHPKDGAREAQAPPLLVMNNFLTNTGTGEAADANKPPKHLETLATTVFQSLFPAIAPQSTPLSSIRRVLLVDRQLPSPSTSTTPPSDASSPYTLTLRHYAIGTRATGLSRGVRKLRAAERASGSSARRKALPDLGRLQDVSEYLLDGAGSAAASFTSGSESEPDTDAEVEVLAPVTTKVLHRRKFEKLQAQAQRTDAAAPDAANPTAPPAPPSTVEKRAVRLTELGPRLTLRLTKVEEGVCAGRVLWHAHRQKTRAEEKALEARWTERRRAKEERRRVQRENVERKRAETGVGTGKGEGGEEEGEGDEMEVDEEEEEEWEDDLEDDE